MLHQSYKWLIFPMLHAEHNPQLAHSHFHVHLSISQTTSNLMAKAVLNTPTNNLTLTPFGRPSPSLPVGGQRGRCNRTQPSFGPVVAGDSWTWRLQACPPGPHPSTWSQPHSSQSRTSGLDDGKPSHTCRADGREWDMERLINIHNYFKYMHVNGN